MAIFRRGAPNGGVECRWGITKTCFSTNISFRLARPACNSYVSCKLSTNVQRRRRQYNALVRTDLLWLSDPVIGGHCFANVVIYCFLETWSWRRSTVLLPRMVTIWWYVIMLFAVPRNSYRMTVKGAFIRKFAIFDQYIFFSSKRDLWDAEL